MLFKKVNKGYNHGTGLNTRQTVFLSNCCAKGETNGAVFICKISGRCTYSSNPGCSRIYRQKFRLGAVLYADFKQARNAAFHRKFFALLNLGFDYWQPSGGAISPADKNWFGDMYNWLLTTRVTKKHSVNWPINICMKKLRNAPAISAPSNPLKRSAHG